MKIFILTKATGQYDDFRIENDTVYTDYWQAMNAAEARHPGFIRYTQAQQHRAVSEMFLRKGNPELAAAIADGKATEEQRLRWRDLYAGLPPGGGIYPSPAGTDEETLGIEEHEVKGPIMTMNAYEARAIKRLLENIGAAGRWGIKGDQKQAYCDGDWGHQVYAKVLKVLEEASE